MNYSQQELVNMMYCLGESQKNCVLASRIYKANYPDLDRYPQPKYFRKLMNRFDRTGSIHYEKTKRIHEVSNEDTQLNILTKIIENPCTSVREISEEQEVSRSLVNKIIRKNKIHPYRLSHHQALTDQDYQRRLQFCNWAMIKMREHNNFFDNVLFSDESSFSNTGRVNMNNFHHYSDTNPRLLREVNHQHRFKINVWAGICGSFVVGPYFFDGNLTGQRYLQFLQQNLTNLQRHIPAELLHNQWFQHDGAPPHSMREVREYLHLTYPNRWIGRGGPVEWPARTPDLSCLDFFLWGFIKNEVYKETSADIEDLKDKIRNAFARVTPAMLTNVSRSFRRRVKKCIDEDGRHFEHLL